MDEKRPVRRFELCTERLETLEDVKKILKALQIRIDTDNPLYEELSYYFSTEVVPRGYVMLLDAIGYEGISKLTYEEMEEKIALMIKEQNNEETD